jgi:hypothetical protein
MAPRSRRIDALVTGATLPSSPGRLRFVVLETATLLLLTFSFSVLSHPYPG